MTKNGETLNILLIYEGEEAKMFTALREKRGLKSLDINNLSTLQVQSDRETPEVEVKRFRQCAVH